jgi:large subunit ribosomal protein L13
MKLTDTTKVGQIERAWHIVDVADMILGRQTTKIANLLMGKSKPYFVSYLDCGDYVVVINAKRVKVSGKKAQQKTYEHFSGYPGGRSVHPFSEIIERDPKRVISEAVGGMLPKNKLRDSMLKRLFVFSDDKHPYASKLKVSAKG